MDLYPISLYKTVTPIQKFDLMTKQNPNLMTQIKTDLGIQLGLSPQKFTYNTSPKISISQKQSTLLNVIKQINNLNDLNHPFSQKNAEDYNALDDTKKFMTTLSAGNRHKHHNRLGTRTLVTQEYVFAEDPYFK